MVAYMAIMLDTKNRDLKGLRSDFFFVVSLNTTDQISLDQSKPKICLNLRHHTPYFPIMFNLIDHDYVDNLK